MKRESLRLAMLVLFGCVACAEPPGARFASVHVGDPSRYGVSLSVGEGLRTCGAVPVGPRLAVTALPCVRKACSERSEEPGTCRLRVAGRNGRTGFAKVALASESDSLALLELRQRVGAWVPLGCSDPWPDESLYAYGPEAAPSGPEARMILTGMGAPSKAGDRARQVDRFAPPTRAPDLSVFIDSDRVRQLLTSYCAAHPSRHCQEAGCRSATPQPRAKRRGVAAVDPEYGAGSEG